MAKITPEEAMLRLVPSPNIGQNGMAHAPSQLRLTYDRSIGDIELLYVINNETNGTSYLCPADDSLMPSLMSWETDNEFLDDMPDNMKYWFKCYEDEIEWWQNGGQELTEEEIDEGNVGEETISDVTIVLNEFKSKWY